MTSVLFALVIILALIVPTVLLVNSSIDTVQGVFQKVDAGTLQIPAPPETVAEWPLVGKSIYNVWNQAHTNLAAVVKNYGPQIRDMFMTVLGTAGGGLKDMLSFIISVAIASALLIAAERMNIVAGRVITRFAGERGPELQSLATAAIRGVMLGVIGVAVIQSVLAAIGMMLVGVPAAGLWAVLVLVLAVAQLPPIIILAPIAAWVFTFASTVPAVLFLVWALIVSGCDGFLKPVLMGRGVNVPMLVVLIGALGGMMTSGIIGLFVGAVVVSISYTIFMAWVEEEQPADTTEENA